jgi:DNA-binding transcriptional MerR regulator
VRVPEKNAVTAQPNERYLSTAEAAAALGTTAKALRVYEQRGLVKPLRSTAGWRAYGPDALTRLHQIIALKRLGLSLAAIGQLLSGRLAQLDAVLAVQEEALADAAREAARALELVRTVRTRLARGETLSVDDLTTLTRETTMTEHAPEWARKMEPMIDRHFSDADKAKMKAQAGPFDQAEVQAQWDALIAEAKSLVGTDPSAPKATDLARRWKAMVARSTGGDANLKAKVGNVWKEAMADPKVAPMLPFGPEVMAFIGEASKHLPPEA